MPIALIKFITSFLFGSEFGMIVPLQIFHKPFRCTIHNQFAPLDCAWA